MNSDSLAQDVFLLSEAFPEEEDFEEAVASTVTALEQVIEGSVDTSPLKYDFAGWQSFHYQHKVEQGAKADCRIVFKRVDEGIEVRGFGHRRVPEDLYQRLRDARETGEQL